MLVGQIKNTKSEYCNIFTEFKLLGLYAIAASPFSILVTNSCYIFDHPPIEMKLVRLVC